MKTQHKKNTNSKISCVTIEKQFNSSEYKALNALTQVQKDFIDTRLDNYHMDTNTLVDFDNILEQLENEL